MSLFILYESLILNIITQIGKKHMSLLISYFYKTL